MDNLSAFQILPYHVVKLIVNHVAGCSRLQFADITTDTDEYRILQIPLLWVCHNFRAFVRERFCRVYKLTLENDRDRAEALLFSWPTRFKELGYPTHHLAKELRVKLDIKAVYTGKALQVLSDAPYEGRSFPLIRKLIFSLTGDHDGDYYWESVSDNEGYYDQEPVRDNDQGPVRDNDREPVHGSDWALDGNNGWALGGNDDWDAGNYKDDTPKTRYIYPPDTAANITAFVQRIRQMAPAVSEIDVWPIGDAERLLWHCDVHILNLVLQLFDIVEKHTVITRGSEPMLMFSGLDPIRDLVRLECSLDSDFYNAWPLIRHNTQTLQFLDLDVGDVELTNAVRDPDSGDYLEYPCLHTLIIRSFREPWPSQEAFSKDIVPFPRLLRLSVLSDYPFGDDILFRGNAGTLEYLELRLLPETVSMLKKYRVFTPTSHPNLNCVKLDLSIDYIPYVFAKVAECLKFVLSIAPSASVRQIPDMAKYPEDCNIALSMLKDYSCIQILSLPHMSLSLWDAITLVKSLSLLSDLTTRAPVLGEFPQGLSAVDLPGHVRATYAPMGKRLRCWHVYDIPVCDYKETTTCVLLLALACPNFDYVVVYGDSREPFMKIMQEKIAEPGFNQDAPRLRRLLFKGWKDC
ncbi:hypothetical protein GGI19_005267 [Coemansia pectinata]|uniref:Uncharacterized protein n=1 Tax=Coemansia pectinata TaxID=1052879 RepID=A0A9W8L9H5_9FUNG|nr:hypothetical protein GGI19_005267 [Coemansia pectinata]